MKAAVLGAGAIGGWLAAALAEAGVATSVVARGASLAAIRGQGLRLARDGVEKSYAVSAGPATELGAQDVVIVATKAQDVARALPDLLPLLGSDTMVVSALNGVPWWFTQQFPGPLNDCVLESVDPAGAVARAIAPQRTVGCVVHASTARTAPGCIRVNKADKLIFGEPGGIVSDRVRWLAETFARSGITTVASDNIRLDTWAKLWGNMNMNPISALTRATTGRMLGDPEIRELCLRMMEEMAAAGARIGLPFAMSAADRMAVTLKLGDFRTSMLNDLENGAPLEYEPQLGAVVEIARRAGTPAPFCAAVLGLVRQLSASVASQASKG
jgi:2-dehydropantoate 2-reductase